MQDPRIVQAIPPELDIVEVSGNSRASLAACSRGSGPNLVWGHSLLGSMAQEDAVEWFDWPGMAAVARLIRYDARGHGESASTPDPADYRWPDMALAMWQVADHYGADTTFLGGASMGCATALHAACQQPARVQGLLFIVPPTGWEERKRIARNYRRAASFLAMTRGAPLKLLGWLPIPAGKGDFKRTLRRETLALLARADNTGITAALRGAALSDLPAPEQLRQLTMPTMILAWGDDPVHPLSTARVLAGTLPNAELIIADNANDPWQWGTHLQRFIKANSAGTAAA